MPDGARANREPTKSAAATASDDRLSHENLRDFHTRKLYGDRQIDGDLRHHHATIQDDEFG